MRPKKIIVFSHNPARDRQSDSVFVAELKKRGHFVWLAKFLDDDAKRITTIKPDIIVLPEIRNEYTLHLANQCKSFSVQVVVKMCEFGITEESLPFITPEYNQAIFGRFDLNPCVDLFLAWGPKMKWQMEQYASIQSEKIIACGGFQFDHYFLPRPEIDRVNKKTILFAGGFPYADKNKQFAIPEALPDTAIQREFVEQDQQSRSRWLPVLRQFINEMPEWNVIIKPHPGERIEPYQEYLKGVSNPFILEYNEPGFITLLKADMLVHAGSTMGYEAHLLDIPAINLHNNCLDIIVSKISPRVFNYEDLLQFVYLCDGQHTSANKDILELMHRDYYGTVDGKGYLRICDAIETLPDVNCNVSDEWSYPKEFKYPSIGLIEYAEQWRCDGCKNTYLVTEQNRSMVKCPYCGIANVKFLKG